MDSDKYIIGFDDAYTDESIYQSLAEAKRSAMDLIEDGSYTNITIYKITPKLIAKYAKISWKEIKENK